MPERLRVRVLGSLVVEDVAERDLGSRQGRTVLKVLAVARGEPVSVDRLADALWGDRPVARPVDQVGVLVSRLRGVLGSGRIVREEAGYRLRADWLDLDELDDRVADAASALAAGRVAVARAAADAALAIARGPVLAGEDGAWLEVERAAVAATVGRARAIALEAAATAGDHPAVSALGEAALAADPYDEVVLRLLMRAHAAAGRPAVALATYARVRVRLVEDLGVSPAAETEAVHAEVLALGDEPAPVPDGPVPSSAPYRSIPGRRAESEVLDRALAELGRGAAVAVEVLGEPGIGKSTLVAGWAAAVGRERATVLRGRCDELGRDLPLQPVVDAWRDHLSTLDRGSAEIVLGPDVGVLGPLSGWEQVPATATTVTDPDEGRLRLYQALLAAIVRTGGGGPVVLVVEDLHLAGASTLGWLGHARRQRVPLLLVLTGRPGSATLPGATSLTLGPLDLAATIEVVGARRAVELHRRSGGHPLLLAALADDDAETGADTLAEALGRWQSALGEAAPTVEVAAILGLEVDVDLLADVLRVPAASLLGPLEAAAVAGVLVEQGAGYGFRHEVVRDAFDGAVGSTRRALVHRSAARILAVRPGADPLLVATHARQGGDRDLAADRFVAAARVAADRFDLEAAEAHLGAALELGPSAAASTDLARLHVTRRDLPAAAAAVADAFAAGGSTSTWEVAAWVAYYRRDYRQARALADEGLRVALDPAARASCLSVAGRARHGQGELAEAAVLLERAVAEPAPAAVHGMALVWLGHARVHEGRPEEAIDLIDRALLGPGAGAHPFAPLHGRFARAYGLGLLGRPADALVAAEDLQRAVRESGEVGVRFLPIAANIRAWVLRWTGRFEEADEGNQLAVEGAGSEATMQEPVHAGRLDLADGRLLAGDLAGAAAIAASLAGLDTWDGTMGWSQRHRLGLLRARLALADGDRDGAAHLAGAVGDDARARTARRHALLADAVVGLAGGLDLPTIDAVVTGLHDCAGLDGWYVVAGLARAHRVPRWEEVARRRAAALVTASGGSEPAARFVDRVLG